MQPKKSDLDRVRHRMMGERNDRTTSKLWFEQNPNLKAVKSGGRCYGVGEMLERPRAVEAPPAHSKVFDDTLTEYQQAQREFAEVRQRTIVLPMIGRSWAHLVFRFVSYVGCHG